MSGSCGAAGSPPREPSPTERMSDLAFSFIEILFKPHQAAETPKVTYSNCQVMVHSIPFRAGDEVDRFIFKTSHADRGDMVQAELQASGVLSGNAGICGPMAALVNSAGDTCLISRLAGHSLASLAMETPDERQPVPVEGHVHLWCMDDPVAVTDEALDSLADLLTSLGLMRVAKLCHNDIKMDNVVRSLAKVDGRHELRLIDLGCAVECGSGDVKHVFSPGCCEPQLCCVAEDGRLNLDSPGGFERAISDKTDVFCTGQVLFQMLERPATLYELAWRTDDEAEDAAIYLRIYEQLEAPAQDSNMQVVKTMRRRCEVMNQARPGAGDLLLSMMAVDPRNRPSVWQLCAHPLLRGRVAARLGRLEAAYLGEQRQIQDLVDSLGALVQNALAAAGSGSRSFSAAFALEPLHDCPAPVWRELLAARAQGFAASVQAARAHIAEAAAQADAAAAAAESARKRMQQFKAAAGLRHQLDAAGKQQATQAEQLGAQELELAALRQQLQDEREAAQQRAVDERARLAAAAGAALSAAAEREAQQAAQLAALDKELQAALTAQTELQAKLLAAQAAAAAPGSGADISSSPGSQAPQQPSTPTQRDSQEAAVSAPELTCFQASRPSLGAASEGSSTALDCTSRDSSSPSGLGQQATTEAAEAPAAAAVAPPRQSASQAAMQVEPIAVAQAELEPVVAPVQAAVNCSPLTPAAAPRDCEDACEVCAPPGCLPAVSGWLKQLASSGRRWCRSRKARRAKAAAARA